MDGFEDGDGCPELDNDKMEHWIQTMHAHRIQRIKCIAARQGDFIRFHGKILLNLRKPSLCPNHSESSKRLLTCSATLMTSDGRNTWSHGQLRRRKIQPGALPSTGRIGHEPYMIGAGISAKRLRAVGYGEEKSLRSNDTETGRAVNRRVEFQIIKPTNGDIGAFVSSHSSPHRLATGPIRWPLSLGDLAPPVGGVNASGQEENITSDEKAHGRRISILPGMRRLKHFWFDWINFPKLMPTLKSTLWRLRKKQGHSALKSPVPGSTLKQLADPFGVVSNRYMVQSTPQIFIVNTKGYLIFKGDGSSLKDLDEKLSEMTNQSPVGITNLEESHQSPQLSPCVSQEHLPLKKLPKDGDLGPSYGTKRTGSDTHVPRTRIQRISRRHSQWRLRNFQCRPHTLLLGQRPI